ncbi:MAG: methylated-DNA--[protein]-cysteine S-methyltransferase [Clostridiales bacterium]|nr:methylated-DNA--[protein]-cysteine S-methyltransferase [Clostridiales bacterium]
MYYTTTYDSPLGEIMIAADSKGIAGLWIQGQKYFEDMGEAGATSTAEFIPGTELGKDNEIKQSLDMACRWLDRYFAGEAPEPGELPLAPAGSEFRRMVWKILCEIPSGKTTTYGEIAKQIADMTGRKTMSAQAVGGAVGHNPISIIIPCHRVVGTNGSLTGYAGGIDKKIALLKLEGVDMDGLFVPKKGTAL